MSLKSQQRSEGNQGRPAQGVSQEDEASSGRTHGFAALANHPASRRRGHSDVGFQLHLFFGVKEVFFFQFPKDPPLGLREQGVTGDSWLPGGPLRGAAARTGQPRPGAPPAPSSPEPAALLQRPGGALRRPPLRSSRCGGCGLGAGGDGV